MELDSLAYHNMRVGRGRWGYQIILQGYWTTELLVSLKLCHNVDVNNKEQTW